MDKKLILFAVLTVIQGAFSNDKAKMEACSQKLVDNLSTLDLSKVPACFSKSDVGVIEKNIEKLKKFANEIPEDCKEFSWNTAGKCLKDISNLLAKKQNDIQKAIMESLSSVYKGSSECYKQVQHQFKDFDKYVENGCK